MATIRTFYGTEPILETKTMEGQDALFGLHRDRNPDAGWGEWRWERMDNGVKEVELDEKLRKILIEDICKLYPNDKVYEKLKEHGLIATT